MIKTLRITSIAAVILSLVFFSFSVVFGLAGDEDVAKLLNSPSVVEKLEKQGKTITTTKSQTSPLTAQAKKFAQYLNPPKPPAQKTIKRPVARVKAIARVRPSGKFKLLGTCVNKANSSFSMALIELPNKKKKWVKQSSKVEHSIIEEIKEGLIVVRSGEKLEEFVLPERPDKLIYLKKSDAGQSGLQEKTGPLDMDSTLQPRLAARVAPVPPKSPAIPTQTTRRVRGAGAWPRKTADDQAKQAEKATQTMGISTEEADNLEDIGATLKKLLKEPNETTGSRTKSEEKPKAKEKSEKSELSEIEAALMKLLNEQAETEEKAKK